MAKIIDQQTGERLNRRFSTSAGVYVREWRGKNIVQSKPLKKRGPLSEKQALAVDKFKQAAILAKECAPSQQITAAELTEGTQFFARDLIFMAIYGTLAWVQLDDGRKLFSVAANQNVSQLLDAIAQQRGEMMFRAEDGWEPVPKGFEGQILSILNGKPSWQDPSGGGGGAPALVSLGDSFVQPGGYQAWGLFRWGAPIFADWEGYDPTEAQFIRLPTGAQRFRITATWQYANYSQFTKVRYRAIDQAGNDLTSLLGSALEMKTAGNPQDRNFSWLTGWVPAAGVEKVAIQPWSQTPQDNRMLAGSSFQIEVA